RGGYCRLSRLLFPRMVAPGCPAEDALHGGAEGGDRQGIVIGIERGLVPFIAELRGALEARMAAMLLAREAVAAKEVVVVVTLERLVIADPPIVQRADIGAQNFGGECSVIDGCEIIADIVEEAADHRLVIGAGPQGAGRRLQ